MKTTPWFKSARGETPVRSGLYQVQGAAARTWWAYWNNDERVWGVISSTQEGAVSWRRTASGKQAKTWRGVLKDG